jgi:glutamate:Na+ symporter, ESS family
VAAAMVGIVAGGVMGGPIGTYLVERHVRRLAPAAAGGGTLQNLAEARMPEPVIESPGGEDVESYVLMKHLVIMLATVAIGLWVSAWMTPYLARIKMALPAYIGAMLVAAVIRNVDDVTKVLGLSTRVLDDIGNVALSLFLAMALMTLRLWEIAGLVVPLLIILIAQVLLIAVLCVLVIPRLMGRDYDSAVMSGGFCGFMLGTTANAMANMGALVERYGPAPKAYLVVPLVGAFFIDFVNAILITFFLNLWR